MNIVIKIDGVDRTDDIDYRTAKFTGRSNGRAGDAQLRLLDTAHAWALGELHTGQFLELFLDGTRVWDGYVFNVGRGYAFDVDDTSQPMATPRYIRVKGADRNVLMSKRFVFGQDDPLSQPRRWPAGTMDREAILWMHEHWLDIADTGINLEDGIDEVATPGPYEEFLLGSTGAPWGVIYEDCAKITGAVYAIWPTDRTVHYHDDLTVTAPAPLCDRPFLHDEAYGYREEINLLNSLEMANDAMVWGAGRGSAQPVFARHEDQTSIDDYGRWQWSDQWVGANRTFTVAKRAQSYVEGSPTHQRGHKDELPGVELVVFDRIFWAGMVAEYHSHIFGVDMPLPVREVEYTFPTTTSVRLAMVLTLEYDTPFGWIDPWGSEEDIPIGDPGNDTPVPVQGETIDEYERTHVDGEWGTATNGTDWTVQGNSSPTSETTFGVDGDFGTILTEASAGDTPNPFGGVGVLDYEFLIPSSFIFRFRFLLTDISGNTYTNYDMDLLHIETQGVLFRSSIGTAEPGAGVTWLDSMIPGGGTRINDWVRARVEVDNEGYRGSLWFEDDAEPVDWLFEEAWGDRLLYPSGVGGAPAQTLHLYLSVDWGTSLNPVWEGTALLEVDWIRATDDFVPGAEITSDVDIGVLGWNGYEDEYQTAWPYAPGSLEVVWQGISLRRGVDFFEVDPENGLFRIAPDIPGLSSADGSAYLTVRYERSGSQPTDRAPIGGVIGDTPPGEIYRPAKQQQLGWGTPFDGTNCAATSSAMCLDRHSEGAFSPTRGVPRAIPPNIRYYSGNRALSGGLTQRECQRAWAVGWDRNLIYPGFHSWNYFRAAIREGRGASFYGIYGVLPERLRFTRTGFRGAHAIYVNEELPDGNYLVFDPLTNKTLVYTPEILRAYGQAFTGVGGTVSASYSRVTT